MNQQTTELQKITSHTTADNFFYWLYENTQVEFIQGWKVERRNNGSPAYIGAHYVDIDWLYSDRAIINDWIERQMSEVPA